MPKKVSFWRQVVVRENLIFSNLGYNIIELIFIQTLRNFGQLTIFKREGDITNEI